ncbi:hypothetical protein ACWEV3_16585 [Saccharopolyspora sp. NPDC003752]
MGHLQTRLALAVDVVDFSKQDNRFQQNMRAGVYDVLSSTLTESIGMSLDDLDHEDRGDGVFVLIPPESDKTRLIDPLLDRLHTELRQHNDLASFRSQLRLRAALHSVDVHRDNKGWVGSDLNDAFRMLNCDAIRSALRDRPACVLGVIVSPAFQSVIKHGYGAINPADYAEVPVERTHTPMSGWLRLVGEAGATQNSPIHQQPQSRAPAAHDPTTSRAGTHFHAGVSVRGDLVSGDKTVHHWGQR